MSLTSISTPKLLAAAGIAVVGLAMAGSSVYAGLTAVATNTTAEAASSGILSLTMANNGAGFSSAVANLAPGDVVNRYVDLTQGATLDGQALTLAVTDATPTKLTTDATNGLHVTVSSCSIAWVPGTGVCGGTTTVLLNNTALQAIPLGTPGSLISGAVVKASVQRLQISVVLPAQTEVTTNGVTPGSTIQGLAASLTWQFTEAQRTATTTTS
jgi:spore coat-associated protein N